MKILQLVTFVFLIFSLDLKAAYLLDEESSEQLQIKNQCGHCLGRMLCMCYNKEHKGLFCYKQQIREDKQRESDCLAFNDIESQSCCCAFTLVANCFSLVGFAAAAVGGSGCALSTLISLASVDALVVAGAAFFAVPYSCGQWLNKEEFITSYDRGVFCHPHDSYSCTSLGLGPQGKKITQSCETCCLCGANACFSCCALSAKFCKNWGHKIKNSCLIPGEEGCRSCCDYCWEPCCGRGNS